jgi:hypothetical protein
LKQGVLSLDFLLKLHKCMEKDLWTRGAARDIYIYREKLVNSLYYAIYAVHPTGRRTGSHSNTPLRFGHLVPDTLDGMSHLVRAPAGDDHYIRLTRGEREPFHPKTGNVVLGSRSSHHLDSTAG